MSVEASYKLARYGGVIILLLLLASLYPIHVLYLFSNDAISIIYAILAASSIRLIFFGRRTISDRFVKSIFLSVIIDLIITILSYTISIVGPSPHPVDGGIVGLLLIYAFYIGLPILIAAALLSLLSLPIERRDRA